MLDNNIEEIIEPKALDEEIIDDEKSDKFCTVCGHENNDSSTFCSECGLKVA